MQFLRGLFFTVVLCCTLASRLDAQATTAAAIALGGIDKLLDRIQSIALYYGGQINAAPTRTPWARSIGVEFGFHVGSSGRLRDQSDTTDWMNEITGMTVKKRVPHTGADSGRLVAVDTEVVSVRKRNVKDQVVDYDLGIAYGHLDGVRTTMPYDVRGYVRQLPTLSLYATWRPLTNYLRGVGFYTGGRLGIISLQDTQLHTTDSLLPVVSLSASTFEVGIPIGLEITPRYASSVHFTAEVAYMRRRFNSLSYNPSKGYPADLPRELDLSGWSVDFGISLPIPKK